MLLIKCVFGLFVVVLCLLHDEVVDAQKPSRLDGVDIDSVLKNKRLLKNYIDCLASTKPCTAEGAELKRVLPDALKTNCASCSPKQMSNHKKLVRYFIAGNNEHWDKLSKIYDPTGEYTKKYCLMAIKEGWSNNNRRCAPFV